jgi:succinate dehydrogenase / fumarate reductase cytochrome b subunit
MSMNLVLLFSEEAYNMICELLGANWYAVAATLVLVAGIVVHIILATFLTLQNQRSRGSSQYLTSSRTKTEWSSKNMYILGFVIILGLLLHLWNFWYKMQFAELTGIHTGHFSPHDGAAYVKDLFSCPVYAAVYLIWLAALWLHLTHGVWSAFQTAGFNSKTWFPRLQTAGYIIATIIVAGFAAVPVRYLFFQ